MQYADYHPAQLDKNALTQLQALENSLGKVLVAFEHDTKPADLSDAQVKDLQSLETKLGVTIVAYSNTIN